MAQTKTKISKQGLELYYNSSEATKLLAGDSLNEIYLTTVTDGNRLVMVSDLSSIQVASAMSADKTKAALTLKSGSASNSFNGSTALGIEFVGSGGTSVSLANNKFTISSAGDVTDDSSGLMTPTQKKKLDGIKDNANNYSLPTASSSTKGGIKLGTGLSISSEVLSVSYGTSAGTACQGNDARLTNDRHTPYGLTITTNGSATGATGWVGGEAVTVNITPNNIGAAKEAHTHGNISNDGKLSVTNAANKLLVTDASSKITAISNVSASKLDYGNDPTVTFNGSTMTFGIPVGRPISSATGTNNSGDGVKNTVTLKDNVGAVIGTFDVYNGTRGPDGASAGFGTIKATVNNDVGTPNVTVTTSGTNAAQNITFAFENLKGDPGPNTDVKNDISNALYLVGISGTDKTTSSLKCNTSVSIQGGNLTATSFNISSSRKVKENIVPTELSALDVINGLNIVNYNYINDETKKLKIGLIAEDSPDLLVTNKHDGLDSNNLFGVILKAIQELNKKVDNLLSK